MEKQTSISLEARLLPKNIYAIGQHDERLSSYAKVVNYLLNNYATEDVIFWAIKKLSSYKQAPQVSAALYPKILYTKALRYGITYKEECVKSLFVKRFEEAMCDITRDY